MMKEKNIYFVVLIKWICGLILFASISINCYSQDKKKMSPSKEIKQTNAYALIQKADNISKKDPKAALDYLEQALSMSLKEEDKQAEAATYSALGKLNLQQGLYTQSVEFYNKSLSIYTGLKDTRAAFEARKNTGIAFEKGGNLDKALEQYKLCVGEAENVKNIQEIISCKSLVAGIYEKQGKNNDALVVLRELLQLEEKRNNKEGVIDINNRIGNIYLAMEKPQEAKPYFEKSGRIAEGQADQKNIAQSYSNISKSLRKEGKLNDELELRKKSAEVNTKSNNIEALTDDYYEIGQIYLEQKDAEKALPYLERSAKLSEETGDKSKKLEVQKAITEVYKQKGDYDKALQLYTAYVADKEEFLAEKEAKLASVVSFNEELSLKQKQIDLLEKDMKLNEQRILLLQEEKDFSRMVIYALSLGLVIVFGSSYMIYSSSRKRRIANQVLALKSLRSQMNPHFIFNALNSVNNYISKNDERAANKYLSDFSKLMRTVMENSQHEFISLATEINILKLYLSLEHSRFKEKFDYEFKVNEEINAELVEVPPMLIQPYIENAVWHGLRYKEDKGLLMVEICKWGKGLKVIIEDDGIGRKRSAELKTANQKEKVSTGLKNTLTRLDIINELYRARMKVEIEDLDKDKGTGTKVCIYISDVEKREGLKH
ncbi:MAG: tetratricopeptide repeat protein [Cytophagaceae bacterium]